MRWTQYLLFFGSDHCYSPEKILYINFKPTRVKMLPPSQRECYKQLQQVLNQLQETATAPELEMAVLRDQFQDVQQLVQSQIAILNADEVEADNASRRLSLQTEIYKQMRLLETDLMLLQASRSSATSRLRRANVSDRIKTLIQYCDGLLQL